MCDPDSGFEDADFWSVQALSLMTVYMMAVSKRNRAYAYLGTFETTHYRSMTNMITRHGCTVRLRPGTTQGRNHERFHLHTCADDGPEKSVEDAVHPGSLFGGIARTADGHLGGRLFLQDYVQRRGQQPASARRTWSRLRPRQEPELVRSIMPCDWSHAQGLLVTQDINLHGSANC